MGACVTALSQQPASVKMQRLTKELADLTNSLPNEATNSIFVKYDFERMDIMRSIIFGASGTPYAHGAFLYEMLFNDDYP
jgi:ubiquitin-protein ligase